MPVVAVIAKNMESKRCKHIDVKHHFIRDNIKKGNMKVEYVPTTNQIADVLTKALDANTFTVFDKQYFFLLLQ